MAALKMAKMWMQKITICLTEATRPTIIVRGIHIV